MLGFRGKQAVAFQVSSNNNSKVLASEIVQLGKRNIGPDSRTNRATQMDTSNFLQRNESGWLRSRKPNLFSWQALRKRPEKLAFLVIQIDAILSSLSTLNAEIKVDQDELPIQNITVPSCNRDIVYD